MKKAIMLIMMLVATQAGAYYGQKPGKAPLYEDLGGKRRIVLDEGSQYPMEKGYGDTEIVNGRIVEER